MSFFYEQDGDAYFNEYDEEKAYWLRELMRQNVIEYAPLFAELHAAVDPQ